MMMMTIATVQKKKPPQEQQTVVLDDRIHTQLGKLFDDVVTLEGDEAEEEMMRVLQRTFTCRTEEL